MLGEVRVDIVVAVHELHILAAGQLQAQVAGVGHAGVGLVHQHDALVLCAERFAHGQALILGAIVQHDDLDVLPALGADALQTAGDVVLGVVHGQNDADKGLSVREDIRAVKQAVGDKVLKVIIETCLLTDEEKEKMCDIVCEAGADYIKTSTGFSTAGATFHDVELMVKGVHGRCKVKAAGGISTVEDMEKFLALGADRLGTSRAVKLLNGEQAKGY